MLSRATRIAVYAASLLLFWVIAAPSAHAYIDPGSGQFVIQIILGALAGAGLAIATFWRRIKSFFTRGRSNGSDGDGDTPNDTGNGTGPPTGTPPPGDR